ncbi:MAG: hypothetical protein DCF19_05685 [Pseudanabaena frigida]|uniref:DUF3800 domain-containing protein n=1 Tax=Pseudanabaena frigida TaxID=945775 RepID=A0A2W4WG45_9CYAN|nr:MAG: hypothetical protein DCF19_05685 [Pseudanabaena frigida]
MTQQIYCDESGFTGNNMSDIDSPFFTYASVAINHCEAEQFVKYLIGKYKIQGNELKFENLKKHNKGKKVISEVLAKYSNCTKLVVHNKKFSIACRFFEYIFEPVLADKSSLFYALEFHKFVSNFIYLHLQVKPESAEALLATFEKGMRSKNVEELQDLFLSSSTSETEEKFLQLLRIFCVYHKDIISDEIESLNGTKTGKWILDLTFTSLGVLLSSWGQNFQELDVFCDQSKPLQEQSDFFNAMIGNSNQLFGDFLGKKDSLGFNLKNAINFVDSKTYYGIQIADVFAGASAFVAKSYLNERELGIPVDIPADWIDNIDNSLGDYCIYPDIDYLELSNNSNKLNWILFNEIIDRPANQQPILEGIEDFVRDVYASLQYASFVEVNSPDDPY